ncbi:helicase HerA-like domain-containing protein [Sphingomonas sp. LY54]|nr:helicase HerA-like domain-containing protein [Sphingomonas sp. LY54]WRP29583.1 helicase HerA-like domain-containing protein [Sphingomonas sp. LY54]
MQEQAVDDSLLVGRSEEGPQCLLLNRANRHGLIAGATGTGKTVTLQGLAEGFAKAGTPVFLADVKGDLAGVAMPGSPMDKAHAAMTQRAQEVGESDYAYEAPSVVLWDLFGEQGHPIRTTVSEMGPLLLARLMGLNDTQEGVLAIAFRIADEQGLLLLDLDDLQAILTYVAEHAAELATTYGNVAKATVGTIQRQLLQLEGQGGSLFFGEPALAIADLMRIDEAGRGFVNVLAADKLMASPKLYATFLLWLLSELFEELPEIGDPERPKLVFFFDEAHLLFEDAPKALLDKVEQVVRLIRSKGVGVYFVTQNPIDIPEDIAGQLGNRVQHALRAFTPKDQKAVKAAAETFRPNPAFAVESVITELRTGEALVSLLGADGAPSPVQRTLIKPPRSRLGPLRTEERTVIRATSPVAGQYETPLDRESAEEILAARASAAADAAAAQKAQKEAETAAQRAEKERARAERQAGRDRPLHEDMMRQVGRSVQRQVTNRIAGQIVRGLLGGLFRGR